MADHRTDYRPAWFVLTVLLAVTLAIATIEFTNAFEKVPDLHVRCEGNPNDNFLTCKSPDQGEFQVFKKRLMKYGCPTLPAHPTPQSLGGGSPYYDELLLTETSDHTYQLAESEFLYEIDTGYFCLFATANTEEGATLKAQSIMEDHYRIGYAKAFYPFIPLFSMFVLFIASLVKKEQEKNQGKPTS